VDNWGWHDGGKRVSVFNEADFKMTDPKDQKEINKKTEVGGIEITKAIDIASITLMRFCALGTHIETGKLSLRKLAGDTQLDFFVIELEDIKIHSVTWSEGEGANKKEKVTLQFARFRAHYKQQTNAGDVSGVADFGFDIGKHEVW